MVEQNPHAGWRLYLAREIAGRLRSFPDLRAVLVAGSVARGYADEYSDLELALVWQALPADQVRHAIFEALGAQLMYEYDGPACEDNLLIGGFQVDLWHATVAHDETVLDDVLVRFSTDLSYSNFLDTLRCCVPLCGEDLIERWRARAQAYPDDLAVRAIREHIDQFETGQLELYALRDNPTQFYSRVAEIQQRIFLILLALNRQYFPTFKWMYRVLGMMAIKPADVAERFHAAFEAAPEEAAEDTRALVGETLTLVERHYPQIETSRARRRLSVRRLEHIN